MENEERNDNPPEENAPGQPPQYNQPPYRGPQNPYARPPQKSYPSLPKNRPLPPGYPPQESVDENLYGVHGWLRLLCAWLFIVPSLVLFFLVWGYVAYAREHSGAEALRGALSFNMLAIVASVLFALYASYCLRRIRPHAVFTAKLYFVTVFAYKLATLAYDSIANYTEYVTEWGGAGFAWQIVRVVLPSAIVFAICFSYLCKSRRVAITYATARSGK